MSVATAPLGAVLLFVFGGRSVDPAAIGLDARFLAEDGAAIAACVAQVDRPSDFGLEKRPPTLFLARAGAAANRRPPGTARVWGATHWDVLGKLYAAGRAVAITGLRTATGRVWKLPGSARSLSGSWRKLAACLAPETHAQAGSPTAPGLALKFLYSPRRIAHLGPIELSE